MRLGGFRHKGLKQIYQDGTTKGLPPAMANKLGKLLLSLETAESWSSSADFQAGGCIRSKAA